MLALGAFGLWLALRTPESPTPEGAQQARAQDQKDSNSVTQPTIDPLRPASRKTMATILLLAGGTRGAGSYPILEIPGRIETVQMELEPPTDNCDVFSAVLQTESGEEIQRWERLRARRAYPAMKLARILVQAGSLKNADYVVKLECVSSSKTSAPNAEYRFKVEKKL
jgi:hypothetical protein